MKFPFLHDKREAPEDAAVIGKVMWQNEVHANQLTAIAMCFCSAILVLCMLFTMLGIFTAEPRVIYGSCVAAMFWHLVPAIVCFSFKGARPWIKYMLLTCLVIGQARVDCGLGYHVFLCILLPVVFSTRYYSHRLILTMAAITTCVFALTTYVGALTGFSPVDRNFLSDPASYARDVMVLSFFPKWLVFSMTAGICAEIARQGRNMVIQQASISQEHSRVETELHTASQIQMRSLPQVDKVMKDGQSAFDLATSILPAKEVGGDFYDFFYIDPSHLALVIADVSGKGVPAALFMMVSKILLDTAAAAGRSPGKILSSVNRKLCEKNINDMFVTVWLGILDLTTGELVTANAGHENPVVCRKDGTAEVIKTRHGLVLGGMDGVRYRDETIRLEPGDTLFVYTDGIPEAHDTVGEMYGMDRLTRVLNSMQGLAPQGIVDAVHRDVTAFAGDAPQFDDSTMLALRLNSLMTRDGLQFRPEAASAAAVQDYVTRQLAQAGIPETQAARVTVGLDKLYGSVVRFSGASWAEVVCRSQEDRVTVIFRDNGTPFDPLTNASPDTASGTVERPADGIAMAREMLDEVIYRFSDGLNETTMIMMLDRS